MFIFFIHPHPFFLCPPPPPLHPLPVLTRLTQAQAPTSSATSRRRIIRYHPCFICFYPLYFGGLPKHSKPGHGRTPNLSDLLRTVLYQKWIALRELERGMQPRPDRFSCNGTTSGRACCVSQSIQALPITTTPPREKFRSKLHFLRV